MRVLIEMEWGDDRPAKLDGVFLIATDENGAQKMSPLLNVIALHRADIIVSRYDNN